MVELLEIADLDLTLYSRIFGSDSVYVFCKLLGHQGNTLTLLHLLNVLFILDESESVGKLTYTKDLSISGICFSVLYVVFDGLVKEKGFLHHETNLTTQTLHIIVPQVNSIDLNIPFLDLIKPKDEISNSRLPTPR